MQGEMCHAQGQNAVMMVMLEHAALRSRVKHSTTEPMYSYLKRDVYNLNRTCAYWYTKETPAACVKLTI